MEPQNLELRAQLRRLDQELEDGDITQKGYEKRRSMLMNRYLGSTAPEVVLDSAEDGMYRASDASRSASLAALSGHSPSPLGSFSGHDGGRSASPRSPIPLSLRVPTSQPAEVYQDRSVTPPSQVGRFQEKQLGVRSKGRQSSIGSDQISSIYYPPSSTGVGDQSRTSTMARTDYAFNPASQGIQADAQPVGGQESRMSTMLDSQQGYFSDFAGEQGPEQFRDSYGGPQRYSVGDALSPTVGGVPPHNFGDNPPPLMHQMPLEPRDVPFAVYDPHNHNVPMSKFDNVGAVLRHRGKTNGKQPAYWVLDIRGREIASITWDKLASRAEKVAQVIRDKSNLYRGDRVALVYRDAEVVEFAVALMGCFIAGVVAVPINNLDDYAKLSLLLTTTQAHLALTTDNNLKAFQRDISAQRLKWPTGVEWWKTNDFGSYHPKRRDETPPSQVPDLAYIEFSRAPTGDLRGVVLSHRTIMHQMACLSAIISTVPTSETKDTASSFLRPPGTSRHAEIILSYLDPREGVGLITGVLLGVYGGHTTVWLESKTVETPGLYAHLISKYRTTIMVADYPGLKQAAYNYQQDPMSTRNYKKNVEPNFSSVKFCMIDTLTVDCEFHEILADRWLRPMRNPRARDLVAPMLCLPEHGGMIISMRDWLGGEERMGCPLSIHDEPVPPAVAESAPKGDPSRIGGGSQPGYRSLISGSAGTRSVKRDDRSVKKSQRAELSEALLDKEALKTNEVVVLALGDEVKKRANDPNTVRVGAFGYPIPDATLALVDPETSLLCSPFSVGEIWVDSPSLSGGFWALPKHTENIFHARPYIFEEGNPTPVVVEAEFLRTGLLGCIIEGKIFVIGLYEDRIRQRVQWTENGVQEAEHRYFFVQHLILSMVRTVPKIYDCSAFDTYVNGEYLPIVLLETQAASTAPINPGGPPRQLEIPFLDTLAERCMEVLYNEHHLRVYCVMVTAPNTLPRVVKNGRRDIGNMLCRKDFEAGSLPCVHVRFGVERAVQNLPVGMDPAGGIWSFVSADERAQMLYMNEKQYSGVDHREVVMDDRTATPLNNFTNIHDLLQWRVSRQPDELSYCTVDVRGKEGKGINWKKLDLKVAAVAMYLKKKGIGQGDHLLLMYTHSEDFVYAMHACFVLGAIAIPMALLDPNRLNEDAPAMLHIIADFKVRALLVNADADSLLKQKPVAQHLKQSALILKVNLPNTFNTSKPTKQSSGCRELGLAMRSSWIQSGYPVLIWIYWTPDQRRVAVQLGHKTIMAMCKVQKETCQMVSSRAILGCVRSTMGLGFIHTCLMGVYLGAPTYLVSPVDFAQNPACLFLTLSRYKIKDTYATAQMLDHAIASGAGKTSPLQELKNLMISTDTRPRADVYQRVRLHFSSAGLERTAINTIYSHVLNPMIASRSYMCVEPIELFLDQHALRRGLVVPVDPDEVPFSLHLQDSGMVPVSTQIAIVNPETSQLCHVGEYGEIWVQSEANGYAFYGSRDPFDAEKFNGRIADGDPNVVYVRTGDLGFLHSVSRPIGPNGTMVEMQVLFMLGNIGETFEVNGLSHFPMDIEVSVERCHRNIVPGGCAVFQAGGLVVILVEVIRKAYLASLVPVILNAVLNEHQLIVDIVAFVSKGDFPRSRLGEKQRGKILASWVTRKLQTIAQFGIRDQNAIDPSETAPGARVATGTGGTTSLRNGSSLRHVESSAALAEDDHRSSYVIPSVPPGIAEMPADCDDSIAESSRSRSIPAEEVESLGYTDRSGSTPTAGDRGVAAMPEPPPSPPAPLTVNTISKANSALSKTNAYKPLNYQALTLNNTTKYSPVDITSSNFFNNNNSSSNISSEPHSPAKSEQPPRLNPLGGGRNHNPSTHAAASSSKKPADSTGTTGIACSIDGTNEHQQQRQQQQQQRRPNYFGSGPIAASTNIKTPSYDGETSSHVDWPREAILYARRNARENSKG